MKKLLLILLCLPIIGFGQEWIFGDLGQDYGSSIQQTNDGGYILAGSKGNIPSSSLSYLIKIDNNFIEQWNQVYGGGINSESASCVRQINNGDYIIRGTKYDTANNITSYLRKIDSNGNIIWSEDNFMHISLSDNSVEQTSDGGFIIVELVTDTINWTGLYPQLTKTNGNGIEQWSQTLSNIIANPFFTNYVQQTTDGGYVVSGTEFNNINSSSEMFLSKTNAFGIEQWSSNFGELNKNYINTSVIQTTDDGYALIGWKIDINFQSNNPTGILIKTDMYGVEQWKQHLTLYVAHSIQQTSDGGYIISGSIEDPISAINSSSCLVKTDSYGIEQWNKKFGLGIPEVSELFSVQQTNDGGYIALGSKIDFSANSDFYLVKTDSLGNITSTFNIPINPNRKLEKTVDILGKETKPQTNTPLIEIYDDGSTEKKIITE
tara:strand:- start:204 stop:1505 length:1302 start_codon:yes stop_codon:yes gene_type:complete